MTHFLRFAASLALALAIASPAAAATVNQVGDTFTANLFGNVATNPVPGLTATADFEVTAWTATSITFEITLTNTADAVIWQSARLSAIGFDTAPNISSATASGLFAYAVSGGSFPNGFGSVDVCAIDNMNNCAGGGSGGLNIGESGVVTLTLNFAAPVTSLDVTNIGIRWQSLDSKRLGISGGSGTRSETPYIPPVPEPSAAIVFGLGALLVGATRKQRR